MAAKVEFPFTSAQWRELERQAMIYKYMVASVPVPPDLLSPLPINFSAHPHAGGGYLYNWRCTNGKDLEPGRCKRTDGKKWRCAREVAPNQKYCERHMHRGRPRSRKPVEVHNASLENPNNNKKKTRQLNNDNHPQVSHTDDTVKVVADDTAQPNNTSSSSHQILGTNLVFPETDTDLSIKAYNNRHIGWVLEDKMDGSHDVQQQWSHLMETKIGLASSASSIYDSNATLFQHGYEGDEQLNLFPYTDLAASEGVHHNDESQFFFNSDLVSLSKHHQIDQPRGFIDAWSNGNFRTPSTNTNDSSVSLTLSMDMAAGNAVDEEMAKIQEGSCGDHKPKDQNWVSGATWVPFARGGPLAEVLHTGSITPMSDPTSSYAGGYANSISPPTTTVSSPSGVRQRAFFSSSDSSVCNSPVISAPLAHSDGVAYQWLN